MKGLMDSFGPERGEGAKGYLRRLANRNGYTSWRGLLRASGVNPTLNSFWKSHGRIAQVLGLEPQWLALLLPEQREGTGLYDPFFLRAAVEPICPACIRQSEYLRHAWSHSFVMACPEHGCELVDHCPSCGTALHDSRHGIAMCDCGYDLCSSEVVTASPIHCWISARIAGDMRAYRGIEELGKPGDYLRLAKLLFQLTVRYDASAKVRPAKVARPKTVKESIAFLMPVATMLEAWRVRFAAHVVQRFATGKTNAYSLSGRLGAWYTNLHAICRRPPAFSPLWEVFSDVVFDQFDGVLRGQSVLKPSEGKQRQFLSLPEAAKFIGVSAPTLQNAVDQKLVAARISRQGTNYRITMVAREEAERVRRMRSEWLSESLAAELLGVADSVLQNLVRAGILGYDSGWRISFYKSGPIPAHQLAPLVDRLALYVERRQTHDTLTFNQLAARRTVDVKALTALYQAIFNGEVHPLGYEGDHGLGGFIFSTDEVKRYLGSVALSNALTLTQLERATGWKYESLSRWVELGLLESEEVLLHGVHARVVTMAAFARFRREWLPVAELAHSIRSKASAVSRRLEAIGIAIVGQTDPSTGGRRGGLIRICDIATLVGLGPHDWRTRRE